MNPSYPVAAALPVSRVLVVNDMEPARTVIAEVFRQEGYAVTEAGGVGEAFTLIRGAPWDALVLDLDMPGMNGLELYAKFVRLKHGERLPVIFFTGRPDEALEASLAKVPWARIVSKPCTGSHLADMMRQCLRAGGVWQLPMTNL